MNNKLTNDHYNIVMDNTLTEDQVYLFEDFMEELTVRYSELKYTLETDAWDTEELSDRVTINNVTNYSLREIEDWEGENTQEKIK